jgi:hypothetical protein
MLHLDITENAVDFLVDGRLAGRYNVADEFKPYFHPLNTPAGETLSLASPHDHKHHKGLMYALRTPEVNFWEERSTLPGERPGRQRHDRFTDLIASGNEIGFIELLFWIDADEEVWFEERRTVHLTATGTEYVWIWRTELESTRDTELIQSQWSAPVPGGLVNYHGLGIRLRRDFGCTGGNRLLLDGVETPFADGMGKTPAEAEFRGSIDGIWPVPKAAVRIRQEQANGLFVLESPFAFFAFGPSNLAPKPLAAGDRIDERYTVTLFDLPESER